MGSPDELNYAKDDTNPFLKILTTLTETTCNYLSTVVAETNATESNKSVCAQRDPRIVFDHFLSLARTFFFFV